VQIYYFVDINNSLNILLPIIPILYYYVECCASMNFYIIFNSQYLSKPVKILCDVFYYEVL